MGKTIKEPLNNEVNGERRHAHNFVILDGRHIASGGCGKRSILTAVHLFVKNKSSKAIKANNMAFHRWVDAITIEIT